MIKNSLRIDVTEEYLSTGSQKFNVTALINQLIYLDKLLVEPLDRGEIAAPDLVGLGLQHLVLLHDQLASGNNILKLLNHVQQRVHPGYALLPAVRLHRVRQLGVVVEEGGNDGKLDLDGHAGPEAVVVADVEKLVEQLDLLLAIGFLLATGRHNLHQLLEDHLVGNLCILQNIKQVLLNRR